MHPSTEVGKLRQERDEFKDMYRRACAEIDSLDRRLNIEIEINDQYRKFFGKNPEYCNWLRDHNLQFAAFKNSPYYTGISPVAQPRPLE